MKYVSNFKAAPDYSTFPEGTVFVLKCGVHVKKKRYTGGVPGGYIRCAILDGSRAPAGALWKNNGDKLFPPSWPEGFDIVSKAPSDWRPL